jgi:DNA topoisomerase-1
VSGVADRFAWAEPDEVEFTAWSFIDNDDDSEEEDNASDEQSRFSPKGGNPYHDKEGHFTGSGGVGHAAPKAPAAPKQAKAKPDASKQRQPAAKESKAGAKPKKEKARPVRGEMAPAKRVGTGKDARIEMADGSKAPSHVSPSMIAPSWTDVQVSVDPKAEVLVTAKDAKGRPKMLTSEAFDARAAAVKFNRVLEMIEQHGKLQQEIQAARKDEGTKDAADCAWLMQEQATRPGSEVDTKAEAKAYGATTLEARHVVETKEGVRLQFVGKEGVYHDHLVRNKELAKMLLQRKKAADKDDAKLFKVSYNQVRDFTAKLDGGAFSPKDFRTSAATRMAKSLVDADKAPSKDAKSHQKRVMGIAKEVSGLLGNKPAEALKSYIHPTVFSKWAPK